jgi:hypothetical protein
MKRYIISEVFIRKVPVVDESNGEVNILKT